MYHFGNRLKELRQEKNLTQADVANAIGTSQRNIGRWENNENEPGASFVIKLANYFEVSSDYLLEITDDFSLTSKKLLQKETLSQNEYKLIEKYRKLSTTEKQLIDQTISTLNSK